jgi:hypothetical protein
MAWRNSLKSHNNRQYASPFAQGKALERTFINTINGQQEQPEPKPVKFNEKEIYEFEEALKERAVRVLDRKWAPNTRN